MSYTCGSMLHSSRRVLDAMRQSRCTRRTKSKNKSRLTIGDLERILQPNTVGEANRAHGDQLAEVNRRNVRFWRGKR
jgi:hypothetical protein